MWFITIIIPFLIGQFIDNIINQNIKRDEIVLNFSILIIVLSLGKIISTYFFNILAVNLKTKISFALNSDAIYWLRMLPIRSINTLDSTYLTQRINSDSYVVTSFIIDNIINLFINIVTFIIIILLLFNINITVGIIISASIPLYIILYKNLKKSLFKKNYELKENQSLFFSKLNEQVLQIKFIKLNSLFDFFSKRLDYSFQILLKSIINYHKIAFLSTSTDSIISQIFTVIIYIYGGYAIINNNLSIGIFAILTSYFSMILNSLSIMLNFGTSFQTTMASYKRLIEIFNLEKEQNGTAKLKEISKIELKNLCFKYENSKNVLENINYTFYKNMIYCIIGKNGAGKSTLLDLIIGLEYKYTGSIKYNDIDINNLDMYSLRFDKISIVEQEPTLISDTIINNITIDNKYYSNETIDELAKQFKLYDTINKKSFNLNNISNDKSTSISGGEKQKICLIRSIIKKSDLLIFDEPTSALDTDSINILMSILLSLKKDKIIIIITHDLEFASIADDILYL
jgi:ATP-binding cassette subfamily C protein